MGAVALGVHAGSGRDGTGVMTLVGVAGADAYALAAAGRREIDLAPPGESGQVFHRLQRLDIGDGMRLLDRARSHALAAAEGAVSQLVAERGAAGDTVTGIALPVEAGAARVDVAVETVIASHPLIHLAETVLYLDAMAEAAHRAGIRLVRFEAGGLTARAATAVAGSAHDVDDLVRRVGSQLGRPWRRQHREAAMAAMLVWGGA